MQIIFFLKQLTSILSQTFTDFEFILIDDGSTDNTLDIIKDYQNRDNRIITIEKKNTGLTKSLNVGLTRATGEWIARMDADDISLPTRIEQQFQFVNEHPDIMLLGSAYFTIDNKDRIIKQYRYPAEHSKIITWIEKTVQPSRILLLFTNVKLHCNSRATGRS